MQKEFLTLTQFHGELVNAKIKELNIDEETKVKMLESINQFQADLFEMAEFDPNETTDYKPEYLFKNMQSMF
jgi:hypothetical protein